jgi:hypothetical protein
MRWRQLQEHEAKTQVGDWWGNESNVGFTTVKLRGSAIKACLLST